MNVHTACKMTWNALVRRLQPAVLIEAPPISSCCDQYFAAHDPYVAEKGEQQTTIVLTQTMY
jgi:hypothetical protein